jgi:Fungal N-terminal domain of STAND proteins
MDPLSITTGCLSLLSAISTATHLVIDFIVSCREARDDITAVSRELSDLDITLHILKHEAEANELKQLPEDLRQYIRDIMVNCTTVLTDLHALLREYKGTGLDYATKWALFGCKEANKIRASLEVHKRTLSLVVETTTL